MIDSQNYSRNISSDKEAISFWKKKPSLGQIFSFQEYKTLWGFLYSRIWSIIFIAGILLSLIIFEYLKDLSIMAILKGAAINSEEITNILKFSLFNKNFDFSYLLQFRSKTEVLFILFCSLLTFTLLAGSFKFTSQWLTQKLKFNMIREVREKAIKKILSFDLNYFSQAKSGELIFLINAETSRFSNLLAYFTNLVIALLQIIFYLILLFNIFWDLTIIIFIVGIIYFFSHRMLDMRIKEVSTSANLTQNLLSHVFHQMIYGVKMIKMGSMEKRECENFIKHHKVFEQKSILQVIYNALSVFSQDLLLIILLISTFLYIYLLGDHNKIITDSGNLLAYLYLIKRFIGATNALQSARMSIIGAYSPLNRVMTLLNNEKDVQESNFNRNAIKLKNVPAVIEARDISFSYGHEMVLENIQVKFEKGKRYALVGFSGSGKSTFLDLLSSVRNPTHGQILIDGTPLSKIDHSSYKHKIGYMNQEPIIFHDSIRKNVCFFRTEVNENEINNALSLSCVDLFLKTCPDGLETELGERGLSISGGERQRIGLARVFLQNSPILLMDEATNALDYKTEKKIYENLKLISKDKMTIVAAHRLSAIQDFDHIIVFNKGKIVEQGHHNELVQLNGFYHSLLISQENST